MEMSKTDHALAVVKAGISAVPIVGGPIASLISDYIPSATQQSNNRAIEFLTEELERLGDRLDVDAVNKNEFSELFKSSYMVIVRTHHEEKLRAAAAAIANILLRDGDPEKLSYTELDHFTRCIEGLSIGAIRVLGHLYDIARIQLGPKKSASVYFRFDDLRTPMPDTDPELLMGLLGELNTQHLVHMLGTPGVRSPEYDNYRFLLPQLGMRFVERLLRPGTAAC